ncbi:hypothetical protein LH918_003586, partial [Escherichia coli]|nr:hypothetical protein [Escherichia coli]
LSCNVAHHNASAKIVADTKAVRIAAGGVVIELSAPFFSGDGKVEMVGSGSEHEFLGCGGHAGVDFAEVTDVKKPTGEVGFFTVPLQSWWLWTGKDSLYLT